MSKKVISVVITVILVLGMIPQIKTDTVKAASNPYPKVGIDGSATEWSNCTYSVWNLVKSTLGVELPGWGWAGQWYANAKNSGYSVGSTPAANSIKVTSCHVAFVTQVSGSKVYVKEGGFNYENGSNLSYHEGWVTAYPSDLVGYIYLTGSAGEDNTPYFTDQAIQFTDDHNAGVFVRIQNPGKKIVSSVGCRLYNLSGSQINSYTETCNLSTSYINYTCNFISDMKYNLNAGTDYKYQLFAIVNGVEYKDSIRSFRTTGKSDGTSPRIQDIEIIVEEEYFKVCLTVTDETKLANFAVKYDSWTNGSDDVIKNQHASYWYVEDKKSDVNRYYEAVVYKKNHNNKEGSYRIKLYISDDAGNTVTYDPGEIIMSDYLYDVKNGTATIKSMPTAGEEIKVPSKFGNYPVTAFYSSKRYSSQNVRKITFSQGIREIYLGGLSEGKPLISNCPQLEEIIIPESVIAFGGVSDCEKLKEITLPSKLQILGEICQCPNLEKITIPDSVTSIIGFINCSKLENIELPLGLQKMGGNAFYGCTKLKKIEFPRNFEKFDITLYRTSGITPFSGCESLEVVSIDSDNPYLCIEDNLIMDTDKKNILFYTGLSDGNITIPESVTTIGAFAFSGSNLKKINLSANLQTIGVNSFSGCNKLKNISIPNSVKKIEQYAFQDNPILEKIVWPSNCDTIPESCFSNCISLKELTIPYGIKTFDYDVVGMDYNLEKITIPSSISRNSFFYLGEIARYIQNYPNLKIYMRLNGEFDQYWKEHRDGAYSNFNESYIIYDDTVDFSSLNLSDDIIELKKAGDTHKISYELEPNFLSKDLVSLSIENSSIATINDDGVITAKKSGTTYLDAKIMVVGEIQTAKCKIVVGEEISTSIVESTTIESTTTDIIKKLSAPNGLGAIEDSGNNCQLYWQEVSGATLYNIYLNGEWISSTSSALFKIENQYFARNVDYSIEVSALNGIGESEKTKIIYKPSKKNSDITSEKITTNKPLQETITPDTNSKTSKVILKRVKNVKGKKVKLSWNKLKGISKYEIQYATNKKFTKSLKKTTARSTASSKTIKKLKKKKVYYFRVRAYKVVGETKIYYKWSKVKRVKIKK